MPVNKGKVLSVLVVLSLIAAGIAYQGYTLMPSVGKEPVGLQPRICERGALLLVGYADRVAVYSSSAQFEKEQPAIIGLFNKGAIYVRTQIPFFAVRYVLRNDRDRARLFVALPHGPCSLLGSKGVTPVNM